MHLVLLATSSITENGPSPVTGLGPLHLIYWNSPACARAARNLHATNLWVLVCVFSVNFQNSEFRICIPLYMCIFSQFSETCYLIFWCMFLKIDWKYTYKGGMLILNSEFWKLPAPVYWWHADYARRAHMQENSSRGLSGSDQPDLTLWLSERALHACRKFRAVTSTANFGRHSLRAKG